MAVSSAPGSNLPGTMTSAAWAVAGSLIAGTVLSIIIAAKAQDAPMAAHAWLFAFAFAAGVMVLGQRHLNATTHGGAREDDGTGYNDGVVKAGAIATLFWGVAGFLVGVVIAFQLAFPFLNLDTAFTNFGRLRPLHTSAVIFAFGGNALIATSFYVVQRTCRTRLAGDVAPWFVFWGYNLFIVVAATGYLMGVSQAREYAEPEWYADLWLTIVWVVYLLVFLATLAKRKEPHIYVANWFYLAFIVTIAMLHIGNNLAIPESFTSSKSYSLFPGVQDALIQWWYGHNAVGFFLTAGFLGMMYYFVPKRAERPVYSYRLSIVHFWSLIFLYIWAGPHHLHFTALPDWAQTLGMTFSIMLWMPSWGGMINGLMTLSGAWDKLRTDPVIRMLVVSVAFYGMSTFEGPVMSVKAVNSLSHYTDWTIGHV
ncbi:MAG: cytochrome-c oxidase, cbb3-type subunit I, partial [Alphaproteobacteria bacterium HGW-Alphaproteobacteria-3]